MGNTKFFLRCYTFTVELYTKQDPFINHLRNKLTVKTKLACETKNAVLVTSSLAKMWPLPYFPKTMLYRTMRISQRRHSLTALTAVISNSLCSSDMRKINSELSVEPEVSHMSLESERLFRKAAQSKLSLGIEPIVFSPYHILYGASHTLGFIVTDDSAAALYDRLAVSLTDDLAAAINIDRLAESIQNLQAVPINTLLIE